MPPSCRCLLCLRGDHDLVGTMLVSVALPDGTVTRTMRLPGLRRRSKRHDLKSAQLAHAFPAGTHNAQRQTARIG